MTKKIATGFFILLMTGYFFNASAQQDSISFKQRKGFIGFTFGPVFPLKGQPVRSSNKYSISGSSEGVKVRKGLLLDMINAGYYFHKNIGVAFKIESSTYLLQTELIGPNAGPSPNTASSHELNSKEWSHYAFLAGVRFAHPRNKITLSAGLFSGLLLTETPLLHITYTSAGNVIDSTAIGKSQSLALSIDFQFNYHLGKRFDFLTNMAIIHSKPEFDFKSSQISQQSDHSIYTQEIVNFNVSFGFAYRMK